MRHTIYSSVLNMLNPVQPNAFPEQLSHYPEDSSLGKGSQRVRTVPQPVERVGMSPSERCPAAASEVCSVLARTHFTDGETKALGGGHFPRPFHWPGDPTQN